MGVSAGLRVEILDTLGAFVTAAFGFVAALAWNGAVQSLLGVVFPGSGRVWRRMRATRSPSRPWP